jgi:hypothetical protein
VEEKGGEVYTALMEQSSGGTSREFGLVWITYSLGRSLLYD